MERIRAVSGMIESRMRVDKKKFGKFIASRREIIPGIETQELLAKKINVSVGYMGKLESGGGLPSFDLFIDLADALQLTPGELMMVMAERTDSNNHFQEMNSWLFERIAEVLAAYQTLISPPITPQIPLPFPQKNEDPRTIAGLERAKETQKKKFPKKPPQETDVPEESEKK
jgi:transcriptional regulator with XRE-family HTH domain